MVQVSESRSDTFSQHRLLGQAGMGETPDVGQMRSSGHLSIVREERPRGLGKSRDGGLRHRVALLP